MTFEEYVRFPARRDQLAAIRDFIEHQAAKTPASAREVWDLVQAVDEAATNIIVHGYRDGEGEIEVEFQSQPGRVTVLLRDRAPLFDPTSVPEPDRTQPFHLRKPGGFGISMIRRCADGFTHTRRAGGGNELKIVKVLVDLGGEG